MRDQKHKSLVFNILMTVLLPVIIYVLFRVITGGMFGGMTALRTIARQSIIPVLIAMAMSFDLMQGNLDYSAGSVVYASAIIGGNLGGRFGTAGIIAASLVVAVVLCSITGILYTTLKIPVQILTIGMLMVYEAMTRLLFKTGAVVSLKSTVVAQPPTCFVIFLFIFAFYFIMYQMSIFGHNVRAIGSNAAVASSTGVNISRTRFLTYIIKGILLGCAGFMYMFSNVKLSCPDTMTSFGIVFEALMGIFISNFLARYCGKPFGIVVGVFSMKMLTTALVACGMAATVRSLISGIFLLVLLCVSSNQARVIEWAARKRLGKQIAEGMK